MTNQEFEQLVEDGVMAIPARFRQKIHNVAILIEDSPSPSTRRKIHLPDHTTLLGLYEGIPHTARANYGVGPTLPDRITLYRRPIEQTAGGNPKRIREVIRDTVWHEIAHHFGLDEPAVRASEARRLHQKISDDDQRDQHPKPAAHPSDPPRPKNFGPKTAPPATS